MSKEPYAYCHISKYIGHNNKKLDGLLEDYCATGHLRPRKGFGGLTFIMPTEATIKKLGEMLTGEEMVDGFRLIQAHIIHADMPTADQWKRFMADIGDGNGKKVAVEKTDGKDVVLKSGVVLTPDPNFRMFTANREANQSVWLIKGKKDIEYDPKAPESKHTFAKERRGAVAKAKGGERAINNAVQYLDQQIGSYVGGMFHLRGAEPDKISNPFFSDLVSLFRCLKSYKPAEYDALISHMSPLPFSSAIFAFLNVSQECFAYWYKNGRYPVNKPVSQWHQLLNDAAKALGPDASDQRLKNIDVTKIDYYAKIKAFYKDLAAARKSIVSGDKLFAYHLAMFKEVTMVIPAEQEIQAVQAAGQELPRARIDFRRDIVGLYETIKEEKHIYLSDVAKIVDNDSVSTLINIFRHSDVCGYRLEAFDPAGNSKLVLRPSIGDDINVLPFVVWHNLDAYDNGVQGMQVLPQQLASLSDAEFAQVLEAAKSLRSGPQAKDPVENKAVA